jgi:hypothetical protein
MRRSWRAAFGSTATFVAAVALAGAAASCSGDDGGSTGSDAGGGTIAVATLPPVATTVVSAAASSAPPTTPTTSAAATTSAPAAATTAGPATTVAPTTTRPATTTSAAPAPPCQLALIVEQTQTAYEGITPSDLACADDWAAWIGRPEDELADGFFAVARWIGGSWELMNLGTAGVCADSGVPDELWTELGCFE